jgi:hypothetical protein
VKSDSGLRVEEPIRETLSDGAGGSLFPPKFRIECIVPPCCETQTSVRV